MRAICLTCGVQFADTDGPPDHCPICVDERQYVRRGGQAWTTAEELAADHASDIRDDHGVLGIGTKPYFAIGQRALLVQSPGGNVLWDCNSLVTDAAVAALNERGGVSAIAISHPHYYGAMADWAEALDVPVRLSAADRIWVMRPHERIEFWEGDRFELSDGVTLLRLGGHFAGATVLHWAHGADGRGALMGGDVVSVAQDRRYATFMRSYPNFIPLPARVVTEMAKTLDAYPFERLYGAWFGQVIDGDAHVRVRRSAERYVRALEGDLPGRDS